MSDDGFVVGGYGDLVVKLLEPTSEELDEVGVEFERNDDASLLIEQFASALQ